MNRGSKKALQRESGGREVIVRPVISITEFAYVKKSTPEVTLGYPNTAKSYNAFNDGDNELIGIMKFDEVPDTTYDRLFLQTLISLNPRQFPVTFSFNVWSILEDFDISTITWTSYQALSKGGNPGPHFIWSTVGVLVGDFFKAGGDAFFYVNTVTDYNGAYGAAIEIFLQIPSPSPPAPPNDLDVTLELSATNKAFLVNLVGFE